jgi:hypothetical protein
MTSQSRDFRLSGVTLLSRGDRMSSSSFLLQTSQSNPPTENSTTAGAGCNARREFSFRAITDSPPGCNAGREFSFRAITDSPPGRNAGREFSVRRITRRSLGTGRLQRTRRVATKRQPDFRHSLPVVCTVDDRMRIMNQGRYRDIAYAELDGNCPVRGGSDLFHQAKTMAIIACRVSTVLICNEIANSCSGSVDTAMMVGPIRARRLGPIV